MSKQDVIRQLANTTLLTKEMSEAILAGNPPAIDEIITWLLIGSMDCEAVIRQDQESSWAERRIARQCLVLAFLLAIAGPPPTTASVPGGCQ